MLLAAETMHAHCTGEHVSHQTQFACDLRSKAAVSWLLEQFEKLAITACQRSNPLPDLVSSFNLSRQHIVNGFDVKDLRMLYIAHYRSIMHAASTTKVNATAIS